MKIQNITNVDGFFKVIDSCKGKVLNLKSKLCQYVSLANIFSNQAYIPELELKAYDEGDVEKLIDFMMSGN